MHPTVLIIEDDAAQRRMLQAALEHARLDVLTAVGGQQGLAYAELSRIDLIMLDLELAGLLDGVQVLSCLKGNKRTSGIPVIMVSARDPDEWVAQSMAGGAACCLTKPYNMENLLRQVRTLLAAASVDSDPVDPDSGTAGQSL